MARGGAIYTRFDRLDDVRALTPAATEALTINTDGELGSSPFSDLPISTATQTALDLKAPLASPALTGTPTAPTASGGTNTTQIATTAFVSDAVATAVTGLLDFKGAQDCSSNPNYPAAATGDAYVVSVAGKIGGGSGIDVEIGDWIIATAVNAGGTEAEVGASWRILEHNLQGALLAANNLSDVSDASAARTSLGLVIGTNVQAANSDLSAIAALSPSNDDVIQRKSGAWTNRTMAQVKTDLGLAKGDVGLGNVDNTSDANKPISTATQSALDLKMAESALTGWVGGPFFAFKGQTYFTAEASSSGSGDLTVYTAPAGKIGIVLTFHANNASAGNRDVMPKINRSSTDHNLQNSAQTISSGNTQEFNAFQLIPLLHAGDVLKPNIDGDDVNIVAVILEVPDTAPIDEFFFSSFSSTGTLYTVASGKRAVLLNREYQVGQMGTINFFNQIGSNTTFALFRVPSGESTDPRYQIAQQTVFNNSNDSLNASVYLSQSDFLAYSSSATGSGLIHGKLLVHNA